MDEGCVFVDLQGFKTGGNTFIPKEICLLSHDFELHFLIESPCAYSDLWAQYKREANYLMHAHHGLQFDSGMITLSEFVCRTLKQVNGKTIIVKGAEKIRWLQGIYGNWSDTIKYVNTEDDDMPYYTFKFTRKTLRDVVAICPHHAKITRGIMCHCALANARELQYYYSN